MIGLRSLTDDRVWLTVGDAWTRWLCDGVAYERTPTCIRAIHAAESQAYELREWGWVRVRPQEDARPAA